MSEALVGLIGALVGAALGVLGTLWAREYQHASDVVQKRLDLRLRQLNEFYGPLYIQRRRAQAQRRMFPDYVLDDGGQPLVEDGQKVRWRLVDRIEEARADPELSRAVETILTAGDEVVQILMKSAGLVAQDRVPEAFQRFVEHHDRLRRSWADGKSQPKGEQMPFPGNVATDRDFSRCFQGSRSENMDMDVDCAIVLGLRWVQDDIAAITTVKDLKGSPIFEAMGPVAD